MDGAIGSGDLKLAAHVARPARAAVGPRPALVLCHGFPAGRRGALTSAQTYPDLADHLAAETGWTVVAFNFRGAGESEGNFSLLGWIDDLRAVVDHAVD
ncbi:MAG: alpha/beta fold hydrolase, partial [Acidimicrobiia bacterium]|nr:alpha/beta fold hydrolase [Acidimicrobiia bacterium]